MTQWQLWLCYLAGLDLALIFFFRGLGGRGGGG